MIKEFVQAFEDNIARVRRAFCEHCPEDYKQIVCEVVKAINNYEEKKYGYPYPDNIHVINDGDYQGTLVFVIPEFDYQPMEYWYVRVAYGSCSGCDTLQGIGWWHPNNPTKQQLDDVMMLALHVVQGLRKMGGDKI